ncbi:MULTISPECIES: glycosyltransferase family 2 protein [unclassified Psychrobacter]|uniref:glycosyltransferase family 2 protein n=1 Tax=unclassified Psychrobacter TaxID=196806 RepID=UPI003FD31343
MSMPLISVVIPVYNKENYLEKCLDSVVNQTYAALEIILINDGSTDRSPMICKEYADRDSRIRFIDKDNQGVSVTRNLGIYLSNGEWLYFLDSDDFLDVDAFEVLADIAKSTDADVIYFGCRGYERGRVVGERKPKNYGEYINLKSFLDNTKLSPASAWLNFFRREVILNSKVTFNMKLKHNEDALFVYSLYCHAKKIVVLDKVLYNVVVASDSVSRKPIKVRVLEDNLLFLAELCSYVRKLGLIEDFKQEINNISKHTFVLALYFKDFSKYKFDIQKTYRGLYSANKDIFYTYFSKTANININIVIQLIKVKHFIKHDNYKI